MADFKHPAWLGPTPFNSYYAYTPENGLLACRAWEAIPWQERHSGSLFDAHTNALRGVEADLRVMRQFYINLTTERLKS